MGAPAAMAPENPSSEHRGGDSALVRLVIVGSVDDGKSTLIGRLLHDSKQILSDQLEAIASASSRRRNDGMLDLSLLTDGLRAEREQGITIDVAYRYFQSGGRKFIIADTPGHDRYTRNMVTGASTADLAVILIDVQRGVVEQTRRHAFIASLLGIRHIVVCVNKMDLIDYGRERFAEIEDQFRAFCARLEVTDVAFIPISAMTGENVVERSRQMPWYEGSALLYHLEHVHIASDRNLIDCRFAVQWVISSSADGTGGTYRGYAGQVAGGVLRPGDPVMILPSGDETRILAIDTYDGPLDEAIPPMSVTLRLAHDLNVSRGDVICRPLNQPKVSRDLEAIVCWMGHPAARAGRRYALEHTTRSSRAVVDEVRYRIDVNTLHRDDHPGQLAVNEIGRLRIRTTTPVIFDDYRRNRTMGSFILIDEATNDTVGAGMIVEARVRPPASRAQNVTWYRGGLTRTERWSLLGYSGATVWLTGLPASGKSTTAAALEEQVVRAGQAAYVLDGDNLRHGLNADLGFDPESRTENLRRTAQVARLFADAGAIAIVSLISPYRDDRQLAREAHAEAGIPFIEVFVNTSLDECERRDPKGLYARARRGDISGFTGIDAPYEPPVCPDIEVRPGAQRPAEVADVLITALNERGILTGRTAAHAPAH